jgi:cytochrome c-type biogenesis protein CcmE
MTKRQNRMILVGLLVSGVVLGGFFIYKALDNNAFYFYTPTDIADGKAPTNKSFRVGGLVETGSVVRDGMVVTFSVTDNNESIDVVTDKTLPDLFKEGQGVVVLGSISNNCVRSICKNIFIAKRVLAKHDENYMPPEVAEALESTEVKE